VADQRRLYLPDGAGDGGGLQAGLGPVQGAGDPRVVAAAAGRPVLPAAVCRVRAPTGASVAGRRCAMMEWYYSLLLLVGSLIVLMAFGLPVVFAFLAVNLVGAYFFLGGEMGLM